MTVKKISIAIGNSIVGLPPSYGGNQVLNSGFDADLSSWIDSNTYWQWTAGRAYHASVDAFNPFRQTTSADTAKDQLIEFDYEVIGGTLRVIMSNNGTSSQTFTVSGSGKFAQVLTNVNKFEFSRNPGAAGEFYIDNVSMREVL